MKIIQNKERMICTKGMVYQTPLRPRNIGSVKIAMTVKTTSPYTRKLDFTSDLVA